MNVIEITTNEIDEDTFVPCIFPDVRKNDIPDLFLKKGPPAFCGPYEMNINFDITHT